MYRNKPLIDLNISSASTDASDRSFDSPMYTERHVKLSDTEKGLEMIGRAIAKDQNVKWQEYWSFLGDFADITSSDGLNKLEHHLRKAHDRNATNKNTNITQFSTPISSLCNRLNSLEVNVVDREWDKSRTKSFIKSVKKMDLPLLPPTVPASFGSPYSCVEKSCQVYSKRLAVSILYNLDSVISVNDVLQSEVKRLNSLISSYKDDARFHYVNFQATHSRFAGLIVHYLMSNNCDLTKVSEFILFLHIPSVLTCSLSLPSLYVRTLNILTKRTTFDMKSSKLSFFLKFDSSKANSEKRRSFTELQSFL